MAEGFVYVLISANCEYLKIGLTEKPPLMRVREINQSDNYGATGPWELSDFRQVRNCRHVERLLHAKFELNHVRIDTGADELFRVSPAEARRALEQLEPTLLVRQDLVDRLFVDRDFALYLEKLFAFTGLPAWLSIQGAWTFSLYPGTSGGRYFTINIGTHEVAFTSLPRQTADTPEHCIVMDKLIYDFPEIVSWVKARQGGVNDDPYKMALPRAVSVSFYADFSEAEKFFALSGVRRAIIAYWSEALIRLRERGSMSLHARNHNYNAVAELTERLRRRDGYLYETVAARG